MTTTLQQNRAETAETSGAILAMCGAMAFFIVSDAFSKLASASVPVSQVLTLRGLYAAIIFAVPVVAAGSLAKLPTLFSRLWALRIAGEIGAAMTFLAALAHMPIANVTTIIQTAPLATTAAAAVFLSERVTTGQWVATVVGFLGALLIVQPGGDAFSWWSIVALASVAFVICRDLSTRRMDRAIPSSLINLSTSCSVALAGLALSLAQGGNWARPDVKTHVYLVGSAAGIAFAYHFLILAIRKAPISTVAPFRYTIVPMSLLVGWLIWHEIPDHLALIGIVVIASSGLYTFLAHQKRQ